MTGLKHTPVCLCVRVCVCVLLQLKTASRLSTAAAVSCNTAGSHVRRRRRSFWTRGWGFRRKVELQKKWVELQEELQVESGTSGGGGGAFRRRVGLKEGRRGGPGGRGGGRRLLMNNFLLLCGDVSRKLEIQKIQKSKRWRTRDQRPRGRCRC